MTLLTFPPVLLMYLMYLVLPVCIVGLDELIVRTHTTEKIKVILFVRLYDTSSQ